MAIVYRFRFRVRRRTTSNWTSSNEALLDSEIGLESDDLRRSKIGDGVTGWNALLFYSPGLFDLAGLSDGYSLFWDDAAGNWTVGPPGGAVDASDVSFSPSSGSALTGPTVADALEQVEELATNASGTLDIRDIWLMG